MKTTFSGLSRRSFLRTGAAFGLATSAAGLKMPAYAQSGLPDIQSVLDRISVDGYVREDYRKLYNMTNEPLWDPAKDWIRSVDWEKVRSELAGTTVRFAIGAADQESAAEGLKPFEELSGIKVELVPIPDDSFYDKAVAEFISGNASFDALQFFSPWLGDFAAPGFLAPLDDYAAKWALPLDDFYDTYRLNYGYFGGKLVGIPFDCDVQMVHLRKSVMEKILGGPIDRATSVLPMGIVVGFLMIGLNVLTNVWVAAPFLIVLGALCGFLIVPMNALLQHRGHNLMGAGRSIAVQNFNEQACILGLGAFYSLSLKLGLSVFGAIITFGLVVAGIMWIIRRWHQRNCINYRDEVNHLLDIARHDTHH